MRASRAIGWTEILRRAMDEEQERLLSFDDVLVTPFTELDVSGPRGIFQGGPHWPEFDRQTYARHCRSGVPVDKPPVSGVEQLTIDAPCAWGGPIVPLFGHQIGEFGMRLGPTLASWPEAVFLHAGLESDCIGSLDRTPAYFQSMVAWLGIPSDRIRFIDRPTRVRTLVVGPQAEQLGGPGPTATHLDWLDGLTAARFGTIVKEGAVYVSRAGMPARFAAETYLEEMLIRSGVTVVRPETLPLQAQLRTYVAARDLIFAEGSAVNGARLLGRSLGHVTVLQRRRREHIARASLKPRSQSLQYVDALRGLVHGVNCHGIPETWSALSVLDDARLVETFNAIGIPLRSHWRVKDFAERRDADAREWLSARHDSGAPGSAESVEQTLKTSGLGHLADLVRRAPPGLDT